MKRALSLLITILLLVSALSGCSAKGKLQGTWQAEVDLSSVMQQILTEKWPDGVYQVKDFRVVLELTFQKNGIFTLRLQEGSMQKALEQMQKAMETDFQENLRLQLTEKDKNVTLEEVLKVTGLNLKTLLQDFKDTFKKAEFDSAIRKKIRFDGYFKPDGEKLYISKSEEITKDDFAFAYKIEDGILTMPMVYGKAPMDAVIPVVIASLNFQKAK